MIKRIFASIAIAATLAIGVAPAASADNGPRLCWNGYFLDACLGAPGWGWGNNWNHWDNNHWKHNNKHWNPGHGHWK